MFTTLQNFNSLIDGACGVFRDAHYLFGKITNLVELYLRNTKSIQLFAKSWKA